MTATSGDRPCRILIVEDESIVAADLERDLNNLGHVVTGIADSGSEAIELARETLPDLVLMDIVLPRGGMDGIETAIEIQRHRPTPIIFITASSDVSTLERAKQAEPVGYISKPFRLDELKGTLTVALHQHRLARRLFDEHSWLKVMLGSIRDGVIATDAQGFVRYLNPEAEALTGWPRDIAEGLPIEQVYSVRTPGGSSLDECLLRVALKMGAASGGRYILETKPGELLTIEVAVTPISNGNAALSGAVAVFRDVTAPERAEQERELLLRELQRSNDELSRFSHAVAHDLQSPARTIASLSQLLMRSANTLDGEQARMLEMIVGAARNMQTLITSLLGFAQAGRTELHTEAIDVEESIEQLRISLHTLIEESGAVLVLEDLTQVVADRALLEHVFQNLITNSIRYRQPDVQPRIRISGETVDAGWLISVSDNGQGIPHDALHRIFEPLHRFHGEHISGTGLGLALCRTIVARHGGNIWAESEGVNKGATFRIFLPKTQAGVS